MSSRHIIKGDIGSPCLHPLSRVIGSDRWPLRIILEFELFWNIFIHFLKFGPKLNFIRASSIKSHDKLSNAFWKSTNKIRPS